MIEKILNKLRKYFNIVKYRKISFGKNVNFRKGFSATLGSNAKIIVGNNCFFNNYCSINSKNKVSIGDNCIFGESVKIYDHNHIFNKNNSLIKDCGYSVGIIEIGNNCWIGSNVCILKNVKIGDNVVIAAGAIVDKDIPSNSILKRKQSYEITQINYR